MKIEIEDQLVMQLMRKMQIHSPTSAIEILILRHLTDATAATPEEIAVLDELARQKQQE